MTLPKKDLIILVGFLFVVVSIPITTKLAREQQIYLAKAAGQTCAEIASGYDYHLCSSDSATGSGCGEEGSRATTCYYGIQVTTGTDCPNYCRYYNIDRNCGSNKSECEARCTPDGCSEEVPIPIPAQTCAEIASGYDYHLCSSDSATGSGCGEEGSRATTCYYGIQVTTGTDCPNYCRYYNLTRNCGSNKSECEVRCAADGCAEETSPEPPPEPSPEPSLESPPSAPYDKRAWQESDCHIELRFRQTDADVNYFEIDVWSDSGGCSIHKEKLDRPPKNFGTYEKEIDEQEVVNAAGRDEHWNLKVTAFSPNRTNSTSSTSGFWNHPNCRGWNTTPVSDCNCTGDGWACEDCDEKLTLEEKNAIYCYNCSGVDNFSKCCKWVGEEPPAPPPGATPTCKEACSDAGYDVSHCFTSGPDHVCLDYAGEGCIFNRYIETEGNAYCQEHGGTGSECWCFNQDFPCGTTWKECDSRCTPTGCTGAVPIPPPPAPRCPSTELECERYCEYDCYPEGNWYCPEDGSRHGTLVECNQRCAVSCIPEGGYCCPTPTPTPVPRCDATKLQCERYCHTDCNPEGRWTCSDDGREFSSESSCLHWCAGACTPDRYCCPADGVTPPAAAADLNNSGSVGVDDYVIFLNNYGKEEAEAAGDINKDGIVNMADYIMFLDAYQQQ